MIVIPPAALLGFVYLLSEATLWFTRRSPSGIRRHDTGSMLLLWLAIGGGITAAIQLSLHSDLLTFHLSRAALGLSVLVFLTALALRWWAILHLGRFFTVDVAIAEDHQLLTSGPYRWVRHPSYSGMILAFAAVAVTLENWLSVLCTLVPITAALAYRIRVEERALVGKFGDRYRAYRNTAGALFPVFHRSLPADLGR